MMKLLYLENDNYWFIYFVFCFRCLVCGIMCLKCLFWYVNDVLILYNVYMFRKKNIYVKIIFRNLLKDKIEGWWKDVLFVD